MPLSTTQMDACFAIFDMPARTGALIQEALSLAGKGVYWFLDWIKDPAHVKALGAIVTDVLEKNWPQAVKELADLFSKSPS